MPEPLLTILKLCALALLYLFFIRVVRAVWAEVLPARGGASAAAPAVRQRSPRRGSGRGGGNRLVVVEPPAQKGRAYGLAEEVTLGRAAGCSITVDDNYASQLHARFFRREGALHVEDLGSTNGTYLNGKKVAAAMPVKRGDRVKVGATVFEVDV